VPEQVARESANRVLYNTKGDPSLNKDLFTMLKKVTSESDMKLLAQRINR
jgi:hypothetical protein